MRVKPHFKAGWKYWLIPSLTLHTGLLFDEGVRWHFGLSVIKYEVNMSIDIERK